MYDDEAPDFGRTGYPSGGERLGPAWQIMWDEMCDRQWWTPGELAEAVEELIVLKTVNNLLRKAWGSGHLESRLVPTPRARKHREYRRPELQPTAGWM